MDCRKECGACCIAASISSPIPGLPNGKPAGFSCIHLTENFQCGIYSDRPPVCRDFTPMIEYCGGSRREALQILEYMEQMTLKK